MALKAILDSLDGIDEGIKTHYTEKDGKFYLDITDFGKHPGAVNLKRSLDNLDKEKRELSTKVTELSEKYKDLPEDFSVEEYVQLKTTGGKVDDKSLQALREQHTQAVAQLRNKHAAELAEKDKAIGSLNSHIDNGLRTSSLRNALTSVHVDPDLLDGAVATLLPSLQVKTDSNGERLVVAATELGEVDVSDYVREWTKEKGKAYLSKAKGPGGDGGSGLGGKNKGDIGGDKTERRTAIASRFPELAQN